MLTVPVNVESLPLAPGERREVLIDMAKTQELTITAGESATFMDRVKGLFEPSNNLISTNVLTIKATGLMSLVTDGLPTQLMEDKTQVTSSITQRDIHLNDEFGINNATIDTNRVDVTSRQGNWERWVITTNVPQAFHIEGVRFKVLNRNGQPTPPEDYGWKDTVWVDGRTELLVQMMQPSYNHFPFLFYSQNLEKADLGSAGQLVVSPQE